MLDIIIRQNPWWKGKQYIEKDSKIQEIEALPIKYKKDLNIDFSRKNSIYVIRGPRQVGKTTWIKLAIKDLLESNDEKEIFYFDCDAISEKEDIIKIMDEYVAWAKEQGISGHFIFLDEVTSVKEWQNSIRFLYDQNYFKNSTVVLTGSNIIDLKKGMEKLPGRGTEGNERILYPLNFREYARLLGSDELKEIIKKTRAEDFGKIYGKSAELMPFLEELNSLLMKYMLTGGFLRAIIDYASLGRVREDTYEIYAKFIFSELFSINKEERIVKQILRVLLNKFGSRMSLHSVAKEIELSAHSTVFKYIEALESLFILTQFYFYNIYEKKLSFRKEKKIHFLDSLLIWSLFKELFGINGFENGKEQIKNNEFAGKLVEGIVAEHILRMKSPIKRDSIGNVWYYYSKKGEVDLVLHEAGIEVKWQNNIEEKDFVFDVFRNSFILSKKDFRKMGDVNVLPVSVFLALLET